ncbi:hypothetical protein A3860_00590 [Niastella vici]|uniref:Uncharacterized protein n=1 Tax=Niastella vici TaxID=1703345 RepID=A0A1V9G8B9_9BACT|nr:glycosyltransferase family 10 [Niastella vici]OQP66901.1 hypothetical protein A3860_00590 [Niastella vici]
MDRIKVNFTDFWPSFRVRDNYFFNLLSKYFQLEISDEPDILFFSNYGYRHLSYSCHKIQFFGENIRPDFRIADYVLSFDYLDHPRHLRFPLYVLYFDNEYTVDKLVRKKSADEIEALMQRKKKFCCFIVSNPKSDTRIDFFHKLSTYKKVDSGGRVLNNIGKQVADKLSFVNEYKFIIAFENSSHPGYTTEKVLEPMQVNTVPIYWGNPVINQEMNTKSFINYHDYNSFDALMERIIEIDNDDNLYKQYLEECLFNDHQPNEYFSEERLVSFFKGVVEALDEKPVSATLNYKRVKAGLLLGNYQRKIKQKLHDWL